MLTPAAPAQFELIGPGSSLEVANTLGFWSYTAWPATTLDLSFGTVERARQPVLWRIRMPNDGAEVSSSLTSVAAGLRASWSRLDDLEQQLTSTRGIIRAVSALAGDHRAFGQRCQAFLTGAAETLERHAWIQTYIDDRCIGWTIIPLIGQVCSVVPGTLARLQSPLHTQALDVAIRSRIALIRMLALIARAAALLAAAVSTPFGPILAVIEAWKLVDHAWRGAQ
jgi:hypothetical protein